MNTMEDWISTGDAARMMGYSTAWFRKKFEGRIPCRRFMLDGKPGHRKWLKAAVERLCAESRLSAS